ncbi:hypothetical protein SAMN02910280_2624 [Ruminococcus flavefaciens]|uniref:Uncharacterized protein n=2 Tax=Ruminococcus flavefaciens TaxID=1265 RepID=A0A1K1PBW6_RUMFL|nr:hypothetical protein SAMN02910280_2624 [Ruminococcus flavefaciens]
MYFGPFNGNMGGYSPVFGPPASYPISNYSYWCNSSFSWHNAWYSPRQVISRINEPEFSARKLIYDKYTGEFKVKERDGRVVIVGKFKIIKMLVVNPKSSTEFEAVYFEIEYEGNIYAIVLSFKEYCRRQFLPHLSFFRRNPDCKDEYLTAAVCLALQDFSDSKFLYIPKRSGWQQYEEGKIDFASADSVFPGLEEYYPEEIKERQIMRTDRALADITVEYRDFLKTGPDLIPLVIISTHAIVSRFSCKDSPSDEAYIIKPDGEKSAKAAVACLKTKNNKTTAICPLTASRTDVIAELDNTNDGVALFRDTSLIESRKARLASFDVLHNDLIGADGKETRGWHVIAIIEDRPSNVPPNFPALHLTLSNTTGEVDIKKLQKLSGKFNAALIKWFVNDPANALAKLNAAVEHIAQYPSDVFESERARTVKGLGSTAWFLKELGLIGFDEFNAFTTFVNLDQVQSDSAAVDVVNDFRDVFNRLIVSGTVRVVGQKDPPYYKSGYVVSEHERLSFESVVLDSSILPLMRTTKRRNILLSALNEAGLLYSNNNYKRLIEVEVAPYKKRTISAYTVTNEILNSDAVDKIKEQELAAFFMRSEQMHRDFMPVLRNQSGTGVAGVAIIQESDTNRHQYVCGATRAGKTFYLCQQAVLKAKAGEKVLIFDHTGGFSMRELSKHLPESVISKYFSFLDINKQGLPVDLMNLDGCESLPDAKNQLIGILSAALRVTGDVQEKVLRRRLSAFLKESGNKPDAELRDILGYLDIGDPIQKKLYEKLYDVFDNLDGNEQVKASWDKFFGNTKQIVVISASDDSVHKSTHVMDMLLSSLYSFKQRYPDEKLTLVIDEVSDHFIAAGSPIDIMLRKGGKFGFTLLLASQEFSLEKDSLGRLIGNAGTLIFFRPKSDTLKDVSKITGIDSSTLAGLEQGECVAVGNFCDSFEGKNKYVVLIGRTYTQEE